MKNYMHPKSPFCKETPSPSSPNPNSAKPKSSGRKLLKENAPPPYPNLIPSDSKQNAKGPLPPRPPPSSSNPLKRKLSMDTLPHSYVAPSSDSGVKVVVRMRPPHNERDEGDVIVQKLSSDTLSINGQSFTFDSVADSDASQLDIFQQVGVPLVENCLAGFNSSVFAYGQTGSGKTYTMWGPANALLDENLSSQEKGLTPRVFERLFARISEEETKHADYELKYQCRCSFLEIYNEQITDLLYPNSKNLQIREDVKSGVYVENLTEKYVCTMKDVTEILNKGFQNRRTGATSINAESSRSHTVFTCVVESQCKRVADGMCSFKASRINLVDLAGSERQKLTGAAGERLKEAGNINRSLSQLGNLIYILAEVSQTGKQRHIPYRDSKLTFLLQESLGGNAKLAMICAISPTKSCKSETFSTIRFAQRAKAIKNKAVVNEVRHDDVNQLREIIRQLKDELQRIKANGNNPVDSSGVHSAAWLRRSLHLLKSSLSCPLVLPYIDHDSDEEMEIDDEALDHQCVEVGLQSVASGDECLDGKKFSEGQCSEDLDVNMEEGISEWVGIMIVDRPEPARNITFCTANVLDSNEVMEKNEQGIRTDKEESSDLLKDKNNPGNSISTSPKGESSSTLISDGSISPVGQCLDSVLADISSGEAACNSQNESLYCVIPSSLIAVANDVLPIIKSPTPSVSPQISSSSRKSLRTSTMTSASQSDIHNDNKVGSETKCLSFPKPMINNSSNALPIETKSNLPAKMKHLAAGICHGLEIIDIHRRSVALRQSPFIFSLRSKSNPAFLVNKLDVGVQTLFHDNDRAELYTCINCKKRMQLKDEDSSDRSNLQLVPLDGSDASEKSVQLVTKRVERVLTGSIRRELELEEFCAKQAYEITRLNHLLQQYEHERECNAIIARTREDKILRLESLMDGILPTQEFIDEELLSLIEEHKLLKEKYENHPEVLRTKIELQRVQHELEKYQNFIHNGEREVLLEEIQDLRSQLQFYINSSSTLPGKQNTPLQLTYPREPSSAPSFNAITELKEGNMIWESAEESAKEKLEQERIRWNEVESRWISLSEELRSELNACRSLAEKRRLELESERKCSEELKEAMQTAMQGHVKMLEQYAELEEKHIQLLERHRKIQEGIEDVKKSASKSGFRGAKSKFINALASEISALNMEREKERRYLRDENKGLQAQLRDTAEAVQAAGELLLRLKEAEEAVTVAQRQATEAKQEAVKAYKKIDKLKEEHEKETHILKELLTEAPLAKESKEHTYDDDFAMANCNASEPQFDNDQQWKEEFKSFYNAEDSELSRQAEPPSSWFSGYDRCNI